MKAAVRVALREDQSRLRKSLPSGFDPRAHGARSMAMVRHFAINPVRSATDRQSLKTRCKVASRNTDCLEALLTESARQPGLVALRRRPLH